MPRALSKDARIVALNGSPVGSGVLGIGDDMSGASLLTFGMEMGEILGNPLVPVKIETLATSFVSMTTCRMIGNDAKCTTITVGSIFGGPFE